MIFGLIKAKNILKIEEKKLEVLNIIKLFVVMDQLQMNKLFKILSF